ncbi:uncharacterized protein B0I36DRAFT_343961 [Microdochium trichocladiopsis]|uniref:Uncharacterized protein n=1 Tax=Microdochium trichocladiopsis TaxID=1682393 RepID=A0A9P8YGW7_9PEZI|nr:uncharacterized protein B0I36DRAFT_343961 [Microdochium trichocladiopsis]KAH7040174.1 hypothetical protein B0I36DRAFT_343961 [Microdochium trichocladiopsis]
MAWGALLNAFGGIFVLGGSLVSLVGTGALECFLTNAAPMCFCFNALLSALGRNSIVLVPVGVGPADEYVEIRVTSDGYHELAVSRKVGAGKSESFNHIRRKTL